MLLRTLLITFMSLLCSSAYSSNLVSVDSDFKELTLGTRVKYLVEDSPHINLNNLLTDIDQFDWQVTSKEIPNFGFNTEPHWLWVDLSNNTLIDASLIIEINNSLLDLVDVYQIKTDGVLLQWHTGDQLPFNSRPIDHRNFLFPISIDHQEQSRVLIRVSNSGAMQIPIKIWHERDFFRTVQERSIPHGIFIGLFLVLILYHLFLYLSTWDISYLYYVVFAGGFLLGSMSLYGYGFQYLWYQAITFQQYSFYLFISIALIGMAEFTIKFLKVPTNTTDYLMLRAITIATFLGLSLVMLLPYKLMIQVLMFICIYTAAISTVVGIKKMATMGPAASLYASGWIILALGNGTLVLEKTALLNASIVTEIALPIAVVMFSLLLSFALGFRIKEEQKSRIFAENNALISEKNTLLARVKNNELEYKSEQLKLSTAAESEAKNAFLAMMSHEIRTPLNGIMGLSHLLKSTGLDEKQKRYADTIYSSGESLLTIINDILDYSKISAGKLDIESIPVNVFDLITNCTSIIANELKYENINLYVSASPAVPFIVKTDPVRLRQVILNYLSNAIKFSNKKDIQLKISLNSNINQLKINVIDQGIGIAKDKQGILFDAFSQADSSTTRKYGGSGLGLAICKQLAQLTGGDVGVSSAEGAGSNFWFTCEVAVLDIPLPEHRPDQHVYFLSLLDSEADFNFIQSTLAQWNCHLTPLKDAKESQHYEGVFCDYIERDNPTLEAVFSQYTLNNESTYDIGDFDEPSRLCRPITVSSLFEVANGYLCDKTKAVESNHVENILNTQPLNGLRILIAEDNPVNQMVITAMIKKLGAEFTLVENGKLAVEEMQAHANAYDLILMDCEMPIMDGFTASKQIHMATPHQYPLTPIIALTAHAMGEHKVKAEAAGMIDFISKPINAEILINTIVKTVKTVQAIQ
jgi:signal transduction histidine kinase/ActR/RegA family two-component response regulator